ISGSAAPAQLETALQLLYEHFTEPRDDQQAFALLERQLNAAVANRERSPGQLFAEKLEDVNASHHYTAQPLTTDRIKELDRGKMLSFYKQRFANAADFTLFMVGAFQLDTALPLLARYVGSLPSTNGAARSQYRDLGIRFPAAAQRAEVVKGREPRS